MLRYFTTVPKKFSIAALFAVIVILFSSALSFAQSPSSRTCKDLFKANDRLTAADLVRADRESSSLEASRPQLKTAEQKVAFSLQSLAERGVLTERVKFRNWYLTSRPAVRILPTGEARLNQMAEAMFRVYGVSFYYDPKALGQDDGAAKNLNLYISEHTAFTGELDLTLFHEIRHIAMSAKESNGQAAVTNGFALRLIGRWPWKNSAEGYPRMISVQERATSYQSFRYVLVAGRALLDRREISPAEIEEYLVSLESVGSRARNVVEAVRAMAVFEKEIYAGGGGSAFYSIVNDQVRSFVYKLPLYVHMHVVPREIFFDHMPPDFEFATPHEKNIFFQMPVGKRIARDMVIAQMEALENGAVNDLAEIDRVMSRLKQFVVSPTQPEFRIFLQKILADKQLRGNESQPVAPTLASRPFNIERELPVTALLPEGGYNFSDLGASFVHSRTFTRAPAQELKDYLAIQGRDAYYGVIELRLRGPRAGELGGTTLRLEWSEASFGELDRVLSRLALRGYAVIEAQVKHASPIQPKHLPNAPALLVYEPVLQKLRDISPDLLTKRNRIRYLRLANSQR